MTSRILIGTDEAGYGPNLGPLVITATAWSVPAGLKPENLWDELTQVLTNSPRRGDQRLFVADSKAVYSADRCLEDLEVPVLSFLSTLGLQPNSIDELGRHLGGTTFDSEYAREPWNATPGLRLPVEASVDHVSEWADSLQNEMNSTGIRLLGVQSRLLFPAEFNRQTDHFDSKGVVLSEATLDLVRSLYDLFVAPENSGRQPSPALVVCDKHGGRNRYDELIASRFDDQFVFRIQESRELSRYRLGSLEFCFRTKAEELLPVALASMVAKYLREVLMHQFNAFWLARVPGLKPTQGYPVDARRFRDQITEHLERLDIPGELIWRNR